MKKHSSILIFVLSFISAFMYTNSMHVVHAEEEVPTACIAQGLSKYMGTIIQGTQGLKNIRLLSPAFNLTNPKEYEIFSIMKTSPSSSGQSGFELFKRLWGFAGNTYTLSGIPAWDWMLPPHDIPGHSNVGYNWIGEAAGATGKPFVFTEYGDFDTFALNGKPQPGKYGLYPGGTSWETAIADMKKEFERAAGNSLVAGINYFSILKGNPDFDGHNLTNDRALQVFGSNLEKAGVNSALYVSGGGFQDQVANKENLKVGWTVEIARGYGDLSASFNSVKVGAANGMNVVIRACIGNSCEFSDPDIYIKFIRDLDSLLSSAGLGPAYVIAGPNEPATERWATPSCRIEKPFKLEEIPCGSVTDPEFHSLRPYPTSPCLKETSSVMMCGQDFVVQEKLKFTDNSGGQCETVNVNGSPIRRCTYNVTSSSTVSLGARDAQFPIMGNTELVPNSTAGENLLKFPQRVNEYVSWYMNGVTFRAEEEPESTNTPQGIANIINFSGPLKKLLPWEVQKDKRGNEKRRIGSERHDQIVACGPDSDPQTCYKNSSDYNRISDVIGGTIFQNVVTLNKDMLPYVPFSSTEDLVGELNMGPKSGGSSEVTDVQLNLTEDTRKLYFAHQAETPELANLLQKTFVSKSYVVDKNVLDGNADQSEVETQNNTPYCEIPNTQSNPGDKLYGDLVRDEQTQIGGNMTYSAKIVCDYEPTRVDQEAFQACMENKEKNRTDNSRDAVEEDRQVCTREATRRPQPCEKTINIPFGVQVKTPNAYEVWDKYVAGNFSIFRRIYPKIGAQTPVDKIKDIPGDSSVNYSSTPVSYEGGGSRDSSTTMAGSPFAGRTGASAKIYFPHIGSVYEYFLKGIQKALRPWQLQQKTPGEDQDQTGNTTAASCAYQPSDVTAQMRAAAQKFGVPYEFMNSIFQTEGLYYRINPNEYKCEPNFAGAVGIMQVVQGTYTRLTCPDERLELSEETASCTSAPGKISRCNVNTIFEIAARVILEKAGLIRYGNDRLMVYCSGGQSLDNLGSQASWKDPREVHRIACAYYGWGRGNCKPDKLTGNYSSGALLRGEISACRNNDCLGDMDYGDFICAFMAGQGWFNACTNANNFPDRSQS